MRILIVDDDEDDRDLFCEAVRAIDPSIECTEARDAEQALHLLKSSKIFMPDFIFLDLNMPRINGKQCLAELKKSRDLRHIPVIIYTSSKRDADKIETRLLGAAHYISKPSGLAELNKALSFVLERKFEKITH
jgi:DNA-binding response OmpR family regulator